MGLSDETLSDDEKPVQETNSDHGAKILVLSDSNKTKWPTAIVVWCSETRNGAVLIMRRQQHIVMLVLGT